MRKARTPSGNYTSRPALDAAAQDYVRLIRDPCNAKLTNTIWPGTSGSLVSRFESDAIYYTGVGETAGVLAFCPGSVGGYLNVTGATADTTASLLGAGFAVPGSSFLTSTASAVRAVACCLEVSFPGTELNRSGVVALGIAPLATVSQNVSTALGGQNVTTTPAQIRQMCQHVERMPQDKAEIIWQPGPGDQQWFELNTALTSAQNLDDASDKNAILVSVAGLPAATGVRIRVVTVVEWLPRANQGLVASVQPPPSRNNINDVLRALPATGGTNWFINAYKKYAPYVAAAGSVISYGAKMLGPAMMAL